MAARKGKVSIIGSGLIGRSWSMLFASVGYEVSMFDVQQGKVDEALKDIEEQLQRLESSGRLRGNLNAAKQLKLIKKSNSLEECLKGSIHCQECVFEDIDLKKKVFQELDQYASNDIVLCSSTSCFLPSLFTENLKHRAQVIVGHPVNPPYYVPLVEIVPAPWTHKDVVTRTRQIMAEIGQKPVTLKKEAPGFVLNRIQYAILDECYRLIADDVMSVEDIDTVMSDGLGMRYAFMGPWETAHLNAAGMKEYFEKYSKGIYEVSQSFGPNPMMEGPVADKIAETWTNKIPIAKLQERRKWRDERLTALALLKKELDG